METYSIEYIVKYWVDDPKFADYLINNFDNQTITNSEYEAICRKYYKMFKIY